MAWKTRSVFQWMREGATRPIESAGEDVEIPVATVAERFVCLRHLEYGEQSQLNAPSFIVGTAEPPEPPRE